MRKECTVVVSDLATTRIFVLWQDGQRSCKTLNEIKKSDLEQAAEVGVNVF